jgi:hypothetical protein
LFGVLNGITQGLTFILPVYIGWQYFPGKEGIISGIIFAGYGLGSFFYTYLAVKFVNPDGVEAREDIGQPDFKPFSIELSSRVPQFFRVLSGILIVTTLITMALLQDSPCKIIEVPNDAQLRLNSSGNQDEEEEPAEIEQSEAKTRSVSTNLECSGKKYFIINHSSLRSVSWDNNSISMLKQRTPS